MELKKQAKETLYSVYTLRKRIKSYRFVLAKLQNCSGSDTAAEIEQIRDKLSKTQSEIDNVSFVVDQLSIEDQTILRLWYFEKQSKKAIAEQLYISSPKTIYSRKDKALKRFIDIFPW